MDACTRKSFDQVFQAVSTTRTYRRRRFFILFHRLTTVAKNDGVEDVSFLFFFVYLPRLWVVLAFTRFERKYGSDVVDRDIRVLGRDVPGCFSFGVSFLSVDILQIESHFSFLSRSYTFDLVSFYLSSYLSILRPYRFLSFLIGWVNVSRGY